MCTTGKKIYRVCLEEDERQSLQRLVDSGKGSAESRRRAQILLLANENRSGGSYTDTVIADIVGVGIATPERVRKKCVMEGVEAALERKVQVNRKQRVLDGEGEAKLTMLACSEPPEDQAKWTLQLLGDKLIELAIVDTISKETVRRSLKKTN